MSHSRSDSSLSPDMIDSVLNDPTLKPSSEEKQLESTSDLVVDVSKWGSHIVNDPRTPKLIAIINPSSGSNKGAELVPAFINLGISVYFPNAIASNSRMRQKLGAELTAHQNHCIVLLCGGDGSNYWATSLLELALAALDPLSQSPAPSLPLIVPFPLGSGNDLSRCLGWGNVGIASPSAVLDRIGDILFASSLQSAPRFTKLDRWSLSFAFAESIDESEAVLSHLPLPSKMMCYLSIGYDAHIAYDFEVARRANPSAFSNQTVNQLIYAKMGLSQFIPGRQSKPISKCVSVDCEGRRVPLPRDMRSLKVLNVNSGADGVFFWGDGASKERECAENGRPRLDDGQCEVMSSNGMKQMIQCRYGLSHAHRLAQAKEVRIEILKVPKGSGGVALQIDGEAWLIRKKCVITVRLCDQIRTAVGFEKPRGVGERFLTRDREVETQRKVFKEGFRKRMALKG